jgi:hypothetical protein
MSEPKPDGGLRELLSDTIDATNQVLQSLAGVAIGNDDAGYLWKWAFFYLVLAADLADSALALADGAHNRALLILRRVMFEHMVRFRYYRQHPDVARAHLDDYEPRTKLFQSQIDDPGLKLILDPAFDPKKHDRKRRGFDGILKAVFPKKSNDWYRRFYAYPSSLMHGDALISMDILEVRPDGTFTVHGASRRQNTEEILCNYVAMFVGLLVDATQQLGAGTDKATRLRARLDAVREGLGIAPDD